MRVGWLHDGPSNHQDQLAVYWRCSPVVCCHDIHPVQLQRCIRSDRVSTIHSEGNQTVDANPDRGVFVYAVLNGSIGLVVYLSRGYLEPREYDLKEYWTWKGSGRPPWFIRAIRRRRGAYASGDTETGGEDEQPVSRLTQGLQSQAESSTTKDEESAIQQQPASQLQGSRPSG